MTIAGRIPVNVLGTVKKGSLLVSSNKPGYARACNEDEDCAASIIAKALTDSKDGKAIALLTLH